jgi:zinc/manganese transport system ATP-binding protein
MLSTAEPAEAASRLEEPEARVQLRGATLRFGERTLWEGLDLDVAPGELLAVLGPNGAGKTTLVKVLLGLVPLTEGKARLAGLAPARARHRIGYVPQQAVFDADLPIRGRDLVGFGIDGHRFGLSRKRALKRARVDAAIAAVGASAYADAPVGRLSGGEQQRLRVAQALLTDPLVLLCDEPLLSLDLSHQQAISALIDRRRREAATSVVFVTHDINPVLRYVDRVLYLVTGRWAVGRPAEVLTSGRLSELYGAPVDVLSARGRIVVVGGGDERSDLGGHHHPGHHEPEKSLS